MSQQPQQQKQPAERPPLADLKYDDNTFFLVIDEGEEDGRLTTHLLNHLPNINPARIMSGVPLQRLSEKHSLALVVRPHVRGNRDMKSWPIVVVGPVACEPFFGEGADAISTHALCEGLAKAMFKQCGRQMPAALSHRDEGGGKGEILRMRYA